MPAEKASDRDRAAQSNSAVTKDALQKAQSDRRVFATLRGGEGALILVATPD